LKAIFWYYQFKDFKVSGEGISLWAGIAGMPVFLPASFPVQFFDKKVLPIVFQEA
jgi:hypothetical protein